MIKYPITINNTRTEILWSWFLDFKNQTGIFEKINPQKFKENIKSYRSIKRSNINKDTKKEKKFYSKPLNSTTITKVFDECKSKYFDIRESYEKRIGKGNTEYTYPKKLYRLNAKIIMDFIFLNNHYRLTNIEFDFIQKLFQFKEFRKMLYLEFKEYDLFTAFSKFYIKHFYIPYLKYKSNKLKTKDKLFTKEELEHCFDLDNVLFKKQENKYYPVNKMNKTTLTYFYFSLRKHYPSLDNLDNQILKLEGLI